MDNDTQAYLFNLGNPYAKLSVLSEEEIDQQPSRPSPRAPRTRPIRNRSIDAAIQDYLFALEDPYAKLSMGDDKQLSARDAGADATPDLLWKTKTEIQQFVATTFTLPTLLNRPPVLLSEFADVLLRLSPRAQTTLHQRICSHTADIEIAHNRLSPKQLDQLLKRLLEMAYDAAALDAEAE